MAPRTQVNAIIVHNTINVQGEQVALPVTVGGAYMVQLPRGKTTYVRVRSFKHAPRGMVANIMWLYTKTDAKDIMRDTITRKKIHNAAPNTLFESNSFQDIDAATFIGLIGLFHTSIATGIYGRILSATQLKDSHNFVYDSTLDVHAANPTLTNSPLPRLDSVEAGSAYPQPSHASVEQLRTRIGETLFRTKASTGSHANTVIIDADLASVLDLVAAVPHVQTAATIRIVTPSPESLGVLCHPDYLVKVTSGLDVIRCKVVPESVRIVFNLNTCRLSVSYRYTRERMQRQKWVLLDNAEIGTMAQGVVSVGVGDLIVSGDGLPVDNHTTLTHVRSLLDLYDMADKTAVDTHSFYRAMGNGMWQKVSFPAKPHMFFPFYRDTSAILSTILLKFTLLFTLFSTLSLALRIYLAH